MEIVHPIRCTSDIERMKAALSKNPRDLLMFIIGINSGLRISDILPLRVDQVRGQTELTIREGKTGKTKTFRFNQAIIDAAAELIPNGAADSDYLFPSRKAGRPYPEFKHTAYLAARPGIPELLIRSGATHSARLSDIMRTRPALTFRYYNRYSITRRRTSLYGISGLRKIRSTMCTPQ